MEKWVCVVGSRNLLDLDAQRIKVIGELLALLGYRGRSGNALGNDQEWDKYLWVQHILPWDGYNGKSQGHKGQYLSIEYAPPQVIRRARQIAIEHHPYGESLGNGAMKMHTRNVFQVLSPDFCHPAEMTIYCAPEMPSGKVSGGTATAVGISRSNGIPTYNLRKTKQFEELKQKLEDMLFES